VSAKGVVEGPAHVQYTLSDFLELGPVIMLTTSADCEDASHLDADLGTDHIHYSIVIKGKKV